MLRHTTIALLPLFSLAASAHAFVNVTNSVGVPVPGLPGYTSYTITATSTVAGEQIQGVDFAGDGSNDPATGKGFFGPMNQVGPPTFATVFADNNSLIPLLYPGYTADQDSQFLISANSAAVAVPSGFADEGSNILQGIWAWTQPQGQSVDLARLVMRAGTFWDQRGSFSLNTPQGIIDTPGVSAGPCLACVSPLVIDPQINNVDATAPGFVEAVLQFGGQGGSGGLDDFHFDSYAPGPGATGSGPVIPATFDSLQRKFHWDTVGSPIGTYKWLVTATGFRGDASFGSITVNITVPEPAAFALVGVALCCVCLFRRH